MQRMCSGVSGWVHLGCVDASGGSRSCAFFFSFDFPLHGFYPGGSRFLHSSLSLYKVRSFQSHAVLVKMNYKFSLSLRTPLNVRFYQSLLCVYGSLLPPEYPASLRHMYLQECTVILELGIHPKRADVFEVLSGQKRDVLAVKLHGCLCTRDVFHECYMQNSAFYGHKCRMTAIQMHSHLQIRDKPKVS